MTPTKHQRITEVLHKVQSASIAFCHQPMLKDTEYPVAKAIAEIDRILEEEE